MSASSMAVCPRCVERARQAHLAESVALATGYGVIPAQEYMTRTAANQLPDPNRFRTFREDYDITGADTGTVTVSYGGSCEVCDLELDFTDAHPIPGVTDP